MLEAVAAARIVLARHTSLCDVAPHQGWALAAGIVQPPWGQHLTLRCEGIGGVWRDVAQATLFQETTLLWAGRCGRLQSRADILLRRGDQQLLEAIAHLVRVALLDDDQLRGQRIRLRAVRRDFAREHEEVEHQTCFNGGAGLHDALQLQRAVLFQAASFLHLVRQLTDGKGRGIVHHRAPRRLRLRACRAARPNVTWQWARAKQPPILGLESVMGLEHEARVLVVFFGGSTWQEEVKLESLACTNGGVLVVHVHAVRVVLTLFESLRIEGKPRQCAPLAALTLSLQHHESLLDCCARLGFDRAQVLPVEALRCAASHIIGVRIVIW
mmetsp:Transcript_50073/g.160999  ORF Transcript_50073/g.160999 Transcript_50073/m.160999 type:complete len:327 (-) Transcript_50073:292-1272(-)